MSYRRRRIAGVFVVLVLTIGAIVLNPNSYQSQPATTSSEQSHTGVDELSLLSGVPVKGKAPKTGYARTQFGDGWETQNGCDTRNIILHRDLHDTIVNDHCQVTSGVLNDPYTGKTITFVRGEQTSQAVQIDHVVALSNAWQTGAQQLTPKKRRQLANDPLELLAVDGPANQQKSDGDAATWLPSNKSFRCQYIERQIKVKKKYHLWVTLAEKEAIERVLVSC